MTDERNASGGHVTRSIFLHAEEVTITCPQCGKKTETEFRRPGPMSGFVPTLFHCPCGRYSYRHSVH